MINFSIILMENLYSSYIETVSKEITGSDDAISESAVEEIERYLIQLVKNIISEISVKNDAHHLDETIICDVIKGSFPEDLGKHALSEIDKSLPEDGIKLIFEPSKVSLAIGEYNRTVNRKGAVALATLLEYISAELIEVSEGKANSRKSELIEPTDIKRTLLEDKDFKVLFPPKKLRKIDKLPALTKRGMNNIPKTVKNALDEKKVISCPEGKIYNPETKRFVKKDGKVGKAILKKQATAPVISKK